MGSEKIDSHTLTQNNNWDLDLKKKQPNVFQYGGVDNVGKVLKVDSDGFIRLAIVGGTGSTVWGSITGLISNQTDLNNALLLKADASNVYTKLEINTLLNNYVTASSPTFTGTATIANMILQGDFACSNGAEVDFTGSNVDLGSNAEVENISASSVNKSVANKKYVDDSVADKATTTQLNDKADKNNGTLTGTTSGANLELSGTLSVTGATEVVNFKAVGTTNVPTPTGSSAGSTIANKSYVDDCVETAQARYLTYNVAGDPFPTKADLNTAIAGNVFFYGGVATTPDANDYVIVLKDETKTTAGGENPTTKYSYQSGTFAYLYIVNDTGFTTAQWDAVNSGITATNRRLYKHCITFTLTGKTINWNGADKTLTGKCYMSFYSNNATALTTFTDEMNWNSLLGGVTFNNGTSTQETIPMRFTFYSTTTAKIGLFTTDQNNKFYSYLCDITNADFSDTVKTVL